MKNADSAYFWEVLHRRWVVALTVFVLGISAIPFLWAFIPAYVATAELLIVSENVNKDTSLADPDLPSIITSTQVLSRVIEELKLPTNTVALARRIKTKLPAKSSILELTYKDRDSNRAAAVANAVADESARYFHQIAISGYDDVLTALQAQITKSRLAVAEADRRLQRASASSGIASSDKALDDLTSQIDDLRAQRGQINASLAADEASAKALDSQLTVIAPIVRGEILQKDPVYQQVEVGVGRDVADLVSEKASFRDAFPGLEALAARVSREKSEVAKVADSTVENGAGESSSYTETILDRQRANGIVAADKERLRATDTELASELKSLRGGAGAGAAVGTLRAERDAALQQYIALIQRLSAAQGDAAQAASLGTLVVVSRAIPGPPQLPTWILIVLAVVVALSLGAAFLYDLVDRRFWGDREIEAIYGRPVFLEMSHT